MKIIKKELNDFLNAKIKNQQVVFGGEREGDDVEEGIGGVQP